MNFQGLTHELSLYIMKLFFTLIHGMHMYCNTDYWRLFFGILACILVECFIFFIDYKRALQLKPKFFSQTPVHSCHLNYNQVDTTILEYYLDCVSCISVIIYPFIFAVCRDWHLIFLQIIFSWLWGELDQVLIWLSRELNLFMSQTKEVTLWTFFMLREQMVSRPRY